MEKSHGTELSNTVGLLCSRGGGLVRARAFHPTARGFNSLHLHFDPWQERQLPPGLQTSTAEAMWPDTPILRPSACLYKGRMRRWTHENNAVWSLLTQPR